MTHKTIEKTKKIKKKQSYKTTDFYLQPEFLKILTQKIASQPKIDPVKIQELKKAIENNNFSIDNKLLAEKMLAFEVNLFKKS